MKLKINLILCLLFVQASIYAQENEYRDSLVSIKESRIAYCLGKIQPVFILNERILIKDSVTTILLNRVSDKDKQIFSLNSDIATYQQQITIRNTEVFDLKQQDLQNKVEIRQLHKKIILLKIGLVAIAILEVYTLVTSH
jgi:hypothetical protein